MVEKHLLVMPLHSLGQIGKEPGKSFDAMEGNIEKAGVLQFPLEFDWLMEFGGCEVVGMVGWISMLPIDYVILDDFLKHRVVDQSSEIAIVGGCEFRDTNGKDFSAGF